MAKTNDDHELDEQEYNSLQSTISRIEGLRVLCTDETTRTVYESFLRNAKPRLEFLGKRIKESKEENEERQRERNVEIARLVESEKALSQSEQKSYSEFLAKEFFTKNDFSKLEAFYSQAWGRLSERGKDEMSHRVWEGIRRDEYKFSELPSVIRGKEMERVYKRFHSSAIESEAESRIPASDRQEFMDAYEAGRKKEAEKILGRPSFKENLFLKADSITYHHMAAERRQESASKALVEHIERDTPKEQRKDVSEPGSLDKTDFSSIKFDGMTVATLPATISPALIPNVREAASRQVT